jgi:hypothetical protein
MIEDPDAYMDPDPGSPNTCGSGSATLVDDVFELGRDEFCHKLYRVNMLLDIVFST